MTEDRGYDLAHWVRGLRVGDSRCWELGPYFGQFLLML